MFGKGFAIIGCLVMAGCASTPEIRREYYCPYPWEDVREAEKYVEGVIYGPWALINPPEFMSGVCNRDDAPDAKRRSTGCVREDGVIVIWDEMGKADQELTYRHEVCHLYQREILGQGRGHEGWLTELPADYNSP